MDLASNIGRRNFPKGSKPQEVLEKLELMRDGYPTWAAVLLFGKSPQSPLGQATVHCGRFRTEIDITDNRMIEGPIISQIDETMDFLKKHTNVRFVITGKPRRDEIWDYPLEALRESVVNAICHRDYGNTTDIQIKVFDDSIDSGPSRDQVRILGKCKKDSAISELMKLADRTNRTKFRDQIVNPLLQMGLLEMTIPEKPNSRLQKYRLTAKGKAAILGK